GWDVVAIYHSDTRTEAYPSWKDISAAGYPQARYLIVSLKDPEAPRIRAFRIVERAIPEEEGRRLERERRRFDEVVAALPEEERQRAKDEWWALEMVTRREVREEELVIQDGT